MSDNPDKDFGLIAEDYVFFETHSTEAEADLDSYAPLLAAFADTHQTIRMLDFGGGTGSFTAQFLERAAWPPERLQLTLVEPVESARQKALARLASFTDTPINDSAALQADWVACFDMILANHVFYYVPELESHLAKLIAGLSSSGLFLTAIAGRNNAMFPIWTSGFHAIGRDIPYRVSEDVEVALESLQADYHKQPVPYELNFPDTEENRTKILRFLLADHLAEMPTPPLLDLFDKYASAGRIEIRTECDHYIIRPSRSRR